MAGATITAAMIAEVAGSGSGKLLDCLLARDRQAALAAIDRLAQEGANWKNVVLDLIEKSDSIHTGIIISVIIKSGILF